MKRKRIIFINGSPRKNGTSYSFARTLKILTESLEQHGQIIHLYDYYNNKVSFNDLKEKLRDSDILALIAPLYVDALPSPDIWLLEKLAEEYADELKGKGFFAIGQCGFPDITRCEPILEMCEHFAGEVNMNWLGGLSYGTGPLINGAYIETLGKRGKAISEGFKLALDAILLGQVIPVEAQDKITLKIPNILLKPMAMFMNHLARKQAKKNGITNIGVKPYS